MSRLLPPLARWLEGYRQALFAEHAASHGCPCGCTEVAR